MEEEDKLKTFEVVTKDRPYYIKGHYIKVTNTETLIIRYYIDEIDPEVIVAVVDKGSLVLKLGN